MQSVAGSRIMWLILLVSALIAGIPAQFGGVAMAGTVDIWSLPGSGSNNITGSNIGIPPSPAWAVPGSSQYEWISYGNTGCNTYVPATGLCTPGPDNPPAAPVSGPPTAIFYQTFTLGAESSGSIEVWADDTADVWLDLGVVSSGDGSTGTQLALANGTLAPNCSAGPVTCTAGDTIPLINLPAGKYTLVFDAYQLVSGTPFGLMYDGALNTSVPEPAAYMLMGLGLAALGTLIRRRQHQTGR